MAGASPLPVVLLPCWPSAARIYSDHLATWPVSEWHIYVGLSWLCFCCVFFCKYSLHLFYNLLKTSHSKEITNVVSFCNGFTLQVHKCASLWTVCIDLFWYMQTKYMGMLIRRYYYFILCKLNKIQVYQGTHYFRLHGHLVVKDNIFYHWGGHWILKWITSSNASLKILDFDTWTINN